MKRLIAAAMTSLSFLWGGAKAEETNRQPGNTVIAMVVLREAELPNPDKLTAYVKEHWPFATEFGKAEIAEGTIFFGNDDADSSNTSELTFVALMDAPIPSDELDYPCNTALGWPRACAELGKSKAHLIVSVEGGSHSAAERHPRATMLAQACLDATNGLGVYLGDADTVWSPVAFRTGALAMTPDDPPYVLWMGLKGSKDEGNTVSVITSGLPSFGLMNVEVQRSHKNISDVFSFVGDIALYMLKSGDVIKDGDTIGSTAEEKIKVTHSPSITGSGETIFLAHY